MKTALKWQNLSFLDKIVDDMGPLWAAMMNIYRIFMKLLDHLQWQFLYVHNQQNLKDLVDSVFPVLDGLLMVKIATDYKHMLLAI